MIKSVAKLFEFNPESISKKKLRQILVMMLLSLPVWPLLMMDQYGMLPDSWVSILAVIVLIVGAISMFCFVCTRFVNRFYFPDKYLDEWEKAIKHRSMSFAFMVFAWVAAPLFLLFTGVGDFKFSMTGEELGLWFVGLLLSFLYLQTFHALWQVEPIDEDELGEPVVKSRKGLFIFAGTMMVFVGGMIILGYMTAHNDSKMAAVAEEAKSVCEERGSRVHWVSIEKENFGFACFDENKALPDSLTGNDPSSQE